jgi:hypothetical protein
MERDDRQRCGACTKRVTGNVAGDGDEENGRSGRETVIECSETKGTHVDSMQVDLNVTRQSERNGKEHETFQMRGQKDYTA